MFWRNLVGLRLSTLNLRPLWSWSDVRVVLIDHYDCHLGVRHLCGRYLIAANAVDFLRFRLTGIVDRASPASCFGSVPWQFRWPISCLGLSVVCLFLASTFLHRPRHAEYRVLFRITCYSELHYRITFICSFNWRIGSVRFELLCQWIQTFYNIVEKSLFWTQRSFFAALHNLNYSNMTV